VLLLLEMIDFSKIHDPHPFPRLEDRVGKAACDLHTTQRAAPVLSEPRIRTMPIK
jgi:hypothetical protein